MKRMLKDLKVKIFADGADKTGMLKLNANPLITGLTTNPTLMRKAGKTRIEAKKDAEDAWVTEVSGLADGTLRPQCNSWYVGANVPGKPRVYLAYVAGIPPYKKRCDEVAERGYEGFVLS